MNRNRASLALIFVLFTLSCGSQTEGESCAKVHHLEIVSGNFQSAFHGETLEPIMVRLLDQNGKPVTSASVEFELLEGTGLSSADDVTVEKTKEATDGEGLASTTVTLGRKSGLALIRVHDASHQAIPVIFRLFSYHPIDENHRPLCILMINDFHMRILPKERVSYTMGGLARIATIFKEIRRLNDMKGISTIIVNTGDDFENTLFHNVEGAISTLYEIYDAVGLDILQVGNHDYHFGIPPLDQAVDAASKNFIGSLQGHPLLFMWGNVDPTSLFEGYSAYAPLFEREFQNKDNSARYNQTVVLSKGGITFGFLGVVTDAAIYTQVAGNPFFYKLIGAPTSYSEGLTFLNPDPRQSDYIAEGIDSLDAEGADLIIVTSHAGLGFGDRVNIPPGKDAFIAEFGKGKNSGRTVDVILSGHSHVQLNHPIAVKNPNGKDTYLVQAEEAGAFVGCLNLEVDPTNDTFSLADYHLIQVDDTIKEDDTVSVLVEKMKSAVIEKYGDVYRNRIGEIGISLSHRGRAQCALGQIVADAFLWKLRQAGTACDLAMSIPSIYRSDLIQGDITEDEAYDVIPLHQLDDEGTNDEPLVILEMAPGLNNYILMQNEGTKREKVSGVAYFLETLHSLGEMLDSIYPGASAELNLEVIQLAGIQYQIDYSAPLFHRIIPASITIGGEAIDPSRSYRIAMVHSIGVNLAYILNFIVEAENPDTAEKIQPLAIHGEEKRPYIDTPVLAWEAFRDYIQKYYTGVESSILENAVVSGERFRSVQPDLMVNPSDITFSDDHPKRGTTVEISIRIRNLGDVPVEKAGLTAFYESTPWDRSDDDDGHLIDEGFAPAFTGSLVPIGSVSFSLGAFPETKVVTLTWHIPEVLPPFEYPIVIRIGDVNIQAVNPLTGRPYEEIITGNNAGPDQSRSITICL